MLVIRSQQLKQFESMVFDYFVEACTAHVREKHVRVAALYDHDAALRLFTEASLDRAFELGFQERDHLRKFLDWECWFGAKFYEQERWEWLKTILHNGLDAAIRVYRIEVRLEILRKRGTI
jgi:hypothetical protein